MAKIKILITVKTYPTISAKYDELVCTAGITENGGWIRLYPIPFRKKPYSQQYKKYEWIEVDAIRNRSDFRPETFRPISIESSIRVVGSVDTKNNWQIRKRYVLKNVYTSLDKLIAEAKSKTICTSLAVFKPAQITDFVYEPVNERDWDTKKKNALSQLNLFDKQNDGFKIVKKLPYKFSYKFQDNNGKSSNLMIEDWETGQLYWNCLAKYKNEETACEKVREKYFDEFVFKKDLYFFLGTTKTNHYRSRNPFIIIGTFHPNRETQGSLF